MTPTTDPERARAGRALVECIVAALLLAITALALATSTRGTLALADDAQLVTRAQALATTRAELAMRAGCTVHATGTDNTPRVTVRWHTTHAANTAESQLDLALERSPIAFDNSAPIALAIYAGMVCP
jgi:Tfp pilus assembly protein PilV